MTGTGNLVVAQLTVTATGIVNLGSVVTNITVLANSQSGGNFILANGGGNLALNNIDTTAGGHIVVGGNILITLTRGDALTEHGVYTLGAGHVFTVNYVNIPKPEPTQPLKYIEADIAKTSGPSLSYPSIPEMVLENLTDAQYKILTTGLGQVFDGQITYRSTEETFAPVIGDGVENTGTSLSFLTPIEDLNTLATGIMSLESIGASVTQLNASTSTGALSLATVDSYIYKGLVTIITPSSEFISSGQVDLNVNQKEEDNKMPNKF